ncbi:MAG: hypothetical protein N3B18_07975 [Desulfobacterota bacterium]|nr:hypothetical protein [Thermodesulfobacteriota bacterium]
MMKKSRIYRSLLYVLLVFVVGCSGAMTKTTISPSPTPNVRYIPADNTIALAGIRKVAIFPFADYSHQQGQLGKEEWGGNNKIIEEITDHLVARGLSVAVQEDVNTVLVDQDIIRPIDKEKYLLYGTVAEEDTSYQRIGTLEYEIANAQHAPEMIQEIQKILQFEGKKMRQAPSISPVVQGATVGLTKEKVVEIAQILGVDLIVRGRIIEYGYKDIGTFNPLYRGIVPVVYGSVKDLFFGASGANGYESGLESIENILFGGGIGAIVGNNAGDSKEEGAAVGAATGWLVGQRYKKAKRSAVVQIRLYAQDGETGDVLWSNRAEIEYTPKSSFAYGATHPKVMFDTAVKEGVRILMESFFMEAEKAVEGRHESTGYQQKEGA